MTALDPERLISALTLLVMALFVASGMPQTGRWGRPLRLLAITGFVVALAWALAETALWWRSGG